MKKNQFRFPVNLQYFAEEKVDDQTDVKDSQTDDTSKDQSEDKSDSKPSFDDLMKDEEFAKQMSALLDKRVTDAVKKTEQRMSKKYEDEKLKAQMTEEEQRKAEEAERQAKERQREIELKSREYKLELIDILEQEELDAGFRDLIDVSTVLGVEDKDEAVEELRAKVQKVKATFNSLVEKKVEAIKKEYLKGNTPSNTNRDDNNTPPNEYEKAKKAGDVKGMLASKFTGR